MRNVSSPVLPVTWVELLPNAWPKQDMHLILPEIKITYFSTVNSCL